MQRRTTAAAAASAPLHPNAIRAPNRSYNHPNNKLDGSAVTPIAKLNLPNAKPLLSAVVRTVTSAFPFGSNAFLPLLWYAFHMLKSGANLLAGQCQKE